jgi:hypothetical protein
MAIAMQPFYFLETMTAANVSWSRTRDAQAVDRLDAIWIHEEHTSAMSALLSEPIAERLRQPLNSYISQSLSYAPPSSASERTVPDRPRVRLYADVCSLTYSHIGIYNSFHASRNHDFRCL